jgi:hypothetical protein
VDAFDFSLLVGRLLIDIRTATHTTGRLACTCAYLIEMEGRPPVPEADRPISFFLFSYRITQFSPLSLPIPGWHAQVRLIDDTIFPYLAPQGAMPSLAG